MKYLKYFLFGGMVMVFFSLTSSRTSRISEGIYPGSLIPELKVMDRLGNKQFDIHDLKGKKVLINFWAAYDAESHRQNIVLHNTLKEKEYQVTMVSVSFDENESVFDKTLIIDGLDKDGQYVDTRGEKSGVYQKFQLKKGFKNYLIDENGTIVAMNVSPGDLNRLLKS
ncbi:peroxiredoxin [Dysgonomonas sp. PH5-45]|uniref:TlpA family protein disulfide reductase n=1 Tax=unclassified Dysgonomonas TaxID=2630389 RepID=UPI00247678B5|nr:MULTISPECIES: thioredoxin-like domain-containing protein [unclassified Dysgonomonas]MDH6355794.1 peroxiredoxin [Dysgonomonas sp. PH5-45]MDH6388692.1 peroxiredoxin [Dysgonomonas sp. PH5-37]